MRLFAALSVFTTLIFSSNVSATGAIRGQIDPMTPGDEYLSVDPVGRLHVLDAYKAASAAAGNVLAQASLSDGEAIELAPFHFKVGVGGVAGFVSSSATGSRLHAWSLAGVTVNGPEMGISSLPQIQALAVDTVMVLATKSGWKRVALSSFGTGSPVVSSLNASALEGQAAEVVGLEFVTADSLWIGFRNGTIERVRIEGSDLIHVETLASEAPMTVSGVAWDRAEGTPRFAAWCKSGEVFVISGGSWVQVASPGGKIFDLALIPIGDRISLRALLQGGGVAQWALDERPSWHLRSPLEQHGFVRTAEGRRLAGESVRTPTSYGGFQGLWAKILGLFHHPAEFGVTEFLVDPQRIRSGAKPAMIRFSLLGRETANIRLGLVPDTVAPDEALVELLPWQPALQGRKDLFWDGKSNGQSVASGSWWAGLQVAGQDDTIRLWREIQIDDTLPEYIPPFVYSGLPLARQNEVVRIGGSRTLSLDLSDYFDAPWADSSLRVTVRLVNTSGTTEYLLLSGQGTKSRLVLDGTDHSGLPLPDGEYEVQIRVSDVAGNTRTFSEPKQLVIGTDTTNFGRVMIHRMAVQASASIRPLLLDASARYRGEVRTTLRGRVDDTVWVSLRLPDGSPLVSAFGETWENIQAIIGTDGSWSRIDRSDFLPNLHGLALGRNLIKLIAVDSWGDSTVSEIPVILDRMETVISSPSEGALVDDTTAVHGIATDPKLASERSWYRMYWAKGHTMVEPGLAIDALMRLAEWKPMHVPFARQMAQAPSWFQPFAQDAAYPKANIGFDDRSSNSLLGWFHPPVADTGEYTLLVVSQAIDSGRWRLSYDSKRVRYAGRQLGRSAASLIVIDSLREKHPDLPIGVLDQTNATKADDSLVYGLRPQAGRLDVELIVVRGNPDSSGSSGGQILRERFSLQEGQTERWVFKGEDFTGQALDSGVYTLVIEATGEDGEGVIRRVLPLRVRMPAVRMGAKVLSVQPNPAYYEPALGIRPKLDIRVEFQQAQRFTLRVRPVGSTDTAWLVLLPEVTERSVRRSWDFRRDGEDVLRDPVMRSFEVLLQPLDENSSWEGLTEIVTVTTSRTVLDTMIAFVTDLGEDSVLAAQSTDRFKFRIKAAGQLQYFPDRRVKFGALVSGDQVIRNFLSVPWGVDFLKYYNSLEIQTNGTYQLHGYTGWPHSEGWDRVSNVTPQMKSLYALRSDRSWFQQTHNSDSIRAVWESQWKAKDASRAYGSTGEVYFGDPGWIGIPTPAGRTETNRRALEADFEDMHKPILEIPDPIPPRFYDPAVEAKSEGGHSCNFFETLNTHRWESPQNWCNVASRSTERGCPNYSGDDYWKTKFGSSITFTYVKPGAESGSLSNSETLFKMDELRDVNGFADHVSLRGPVRLHDEDVATGPNPHYPGRRVFWTKRDLNGWSTSSSHALNGGWEDDDGQAAFVELPYLHWEHPHLLVHGIVEDSLNQAFLKSRQWSDPVTWNGKHQQTWNCFSYRDGQATDKDTCYQSFAGSKQGVRGFAIYPSIGKFTARNGKQYAQYDYIPNFFDRAQPTGMAAWLHDRSNPRNSDDLRFQPVLDISDAMMGVTWDTLSIPFPYDSRDFQQALTFEKSENDSVLAWTSRDSLHVVPMLSDTSQFLKLSYRARLRDTANLAFVDSAEIKLDSLFQQFLAVTDSGYAAANTPKLYRYAHRKGLHWQVPLQSYRITPDGWVEEPDSVDFYHSVSIRDTLGRPGVVRAVVYYRNKPTILGDWTSEMDSTFARTRGWIYGSNVFNAQGFRDRGASAPQGFLALVNPAILEPAAPNSLAPFVLLDGRVAMNPSLSLSEFRWIKQVYYADGSSPNEDLDTVATPAQTDAGIPNNFHLGLNLESSSKTFLPIRGAIPATILRSGKTWTFRRYSVYARRQADTSSFEPMAVNRFFRSETASLEQADLFPRTALDFWETDTTAAPVLAWWDVSRRNGAHQVLIEATYADPSGDERVVRQFIRAELGVVAQRGDSVEVRAPYGRAALAMDSGLTVEGTHISLHTLAPSDLRLGANQPQIVPVGPVIQIETDGAKTFPTGRYPQLTYRFTAREIFQLENRGDFQSLSLDSIRKFLDHTLPAYKVQVLSAEGTLDAAATTYAILNLNQENKDEILVELIGRLPHFSAAVLLRDDGHQGAIPGIDSVRVRNGLVHVWGRYIRGEDALPPGLLPADLELWHRADTLARGAESGPLTPSISRIGLFHDSLALVEGWHTIVARYKGSTSGDRRSIYVEPTNFRTWGWSVQPVALAPACGEPLQSIRFQANRKQRASWQILDDRGSVGDVRSIEVQPGENALAWDGCQGAVRLASGLWSHRLLFGADSSQDRTLRFAIGDHPVPGIRSLAAEPRVFLPSRSDRSQSMSLRVLHPGIPMERLVVRLQRSATGEELLLAEGVTADSITVFHWDGLIDGQVATGDWEALVWDRDDTLERRDERFRIVAGQDPHVVLTFEPASLRFPVLDAQAVLRTDLPLQVEMWLSHGTGQRLTMLAGQTKPQAIASGTRSWTWSLTNPEAIVPRRLHARWATAEGLRGTDSLDLAVEVIPDSTHAVVVTATDSIFPDFPQAMLRVGERTLANAARVSYSAKKAETLVLTWLGSQRRAVRIDTVRTSPGLNVLVWDGKDSTGSFVAEGRYEWVAVLLPMHTQGASRSVGSGSLYVARLPSLVVSADPYALLRSPQTSGDARFAERIAAQARAKGVRSVRVLDAEGTLAYMNAHRRGVVAFADAVLPPTLFSGKPWNTVFQFVRQGGKVGFVGDLPLAHAWVGDKRIATPGATMAVLGWVNPYDRPSSLEQMAQKSMLHGGFRDADTAQLGELRLVGSRGQDSLPGAAIRDSLFDSVGQWIALTRHRALRERQDDKGIKTLDTLALYSSFFGAPTMWLGNPDSSGSILCVHPYLRQDHSAKLPEVAHDYGDLLYRYFFAEDLSLAPREQRIASSLRILRDGQIELSTRLRYLGEAGLDSAVLRVSDPSNGGLDTSIVIRSIDRFGDFSRSWILPVASDAGFGTHQLEIRVDPFARVDTAMSDTVREENLFNNRVLVSYVVADDQPPKLALLDTLTNGALLPALSNSLAAVPGKLRGWVGVRHGVGEIAVSVRLVRQNGDTIRLWDGQLAAADSAAFEAALQPLSSLVLGERLKVVVVAQDAFGNRSSAVKEILVDSEAPLITRWEMVGVPVDPSGKIFTPPAGNTDRFRLAASDPAKIHTVELFKSMKSDTVSVMHGDVLFADLSLANLDTLWGESDPDQPTILQVRVTDWAGNSSESEISIVRDLYSPWVRVWSVSRNMLDSVRALPDDATMALDRIPLYIRVTAEDSSAHVPYDAADTRYAQILGGGMPPSKNASASWTATLPTHVGETKAFVVDVTDDSRAYTEYRLDGRLLTPVDFQPYLREGSDSLLANLASRAQVAMHPRQRLLIVPITLSFHTLEVTARDSAGHLTQAVLDLESPDADLQVVDSVEDHHGTGADWGKVWMRRNDTLMTGLAEPQTWNYWLIERLNPLGLSEQETTPYRLFVDVDADSTTGLPTAPAKGADLALDLLASDASDVGAGLRVQRLHWEVASSQWVADCPELSEGIWALEGLSVDGNQLDDLSTIELGEGDQTLPDRRVARASLGAMEIGLRLNSARDLRAPIRWALLPLDAEGDSIRDTSGAMLVFQPHRRRFVQVDGFTSEWLQSPADPRLLEVRTTDRVNRDTLRVRISLRNPGAAPVAGFALRYFIRSETPASLALEGEPGAWASKLQVTGPSPASQYGEGVWSILVKCVECVLTGGQEIDPALTLKLVGAGVRLPADDWSHSDDGTAVNPRVPLYHPLTDMLLGGVEPPVQTLRLPSVQIVQEPNNGWLRPGLTKILRAVITDPEGADLLVEWTHEGLGTIRQGLLDTVAFDRIGTYRVRVKVWDPAHAQRSAYSFVDLVVVDQAGNPGEGPAVTAEEWIFDDSWHHHGPQYMMGSGIVLDRGLDSLRSPTGERRAVLPARGDRMLSVPLDSLPYGISQILCDPDPDNSSLTCAQDIDLSRFTNLEFKVAVDAHLPEPIRIWMTNAIWGQGNDLSEEDFVYLDNYLDDPAHSDRWQLVSIPLAEFLTEQERNNSLRALKIMRDDGPNGEISSRRILLDDIRLVRYSQEPDAIVTTRKTGLSVVGEPDPYWFTRTQDNHIGTMVRLLNHGSLPIHLDSLRLRYYFGSPELLPDGAIRYGTDRAEFTHSSSHPADSTLDRNLIQDRVQIGFGLPGIANDRATRYMEVRWSPTGTLADTGIKLRPTASFASWYQVGHYDACVVAPNYCSNTLLSFTLHDGVQSSHWSWPRPVNTWQFLRGVVVDHLRSDGTWGRIWGVAPGEDPAAVEVWRREKLVDPSADVEVGALPTARIRHDRDSSIVGIQDRFDANASTDPQGTPLSFQWLASDGSVLAEGPIWSPVWQGPGPAMVRLRAFDPDHPWRYAVDSLLITAVVDAAAPPVLASSVLFDDELSSSWSNEWPWPTGVEGSFLASEVALDSSCVAASDHLRPVEGSQFLVLPFRSRPSLLGTQFVHYETQAVSLLDGFTNLEFWVASERKDSRLPVRIWVTQERAPSSGNDNNSNEEDFLYLQSYLPAGRLLPGWQKVSIPISEVLRRQGGIATDPRRLFLKIQVDNSASGGVVDNTLRENLFLDGIQLVRYQDPWGRTVTTRQSAVQVAAQNEHPIESARVLDLTLRLLNVRPQSQRLDSLRLRVFTWSPASSFESDWRSLSGMVGLDEGVSSSVYTSAHASSIKTLEQGPDDSGRMSNQFSEIRWTEPGLSLPARRGFSAFLQVGCGADMPVYSEGKSIQWALPDWSIGYQMAPRFVLEGQQPDGSWKRMWGRAPGEAATPSLLGSEGLVLPGERIPPASSLVRGSGACQAPPDTGTADSNVFVTPSDPSRWVVEPQNTGSVQLQQVQVGGETSIGIAVAPGSHPDPYLLGVPFVFDSSWKANRQVAVKIWLDPAFYGAYSYFDAMRLSMQGTRHYVDLQPVGSADLRIALGAWKEFVFQYDPASMDLGEAFKLRIYLNAANSQQQSSYNIGGVRLISSSSNGGSGSGSGSDGGTGGGSGSVGAGPVEDFSSTANLILSTGALVQTALIDEKQVLSVATFSGSPQFAISRTVDSVFRAKNTLELDIKPEGLALTNWEYAQIILYDPASGRSWDELHGDNGSSQVPLGTGTDWRTLRFHYTPSLYGLGTQMEIRIVLNATRQGSSSRIHLDALRYGQ